MRNPDRRDVLVAGVGGGVLAWAWPGVRDGPQEEKPAPAPGTQEVRPLPFKADALRGISARMITSHHENNYAGAVKNLNRVEVELAGVTKDTPAYLVAALRDRELTFRNSKALHELYFGNLGGEGAAPGEVQAWLGGAFGTFGRFEELFRATGMSLGGGSGWAVLAHDLRQDRPVVFGSQGHSQALAAGVPLLVLDMFEHAYHLDYGAAAAKYVEAFFANVAWAEVHRRWTRARSAAAALQG